MAFFRPGHNTDCRQEYLARGAQQQAAQREEREREESRNRLLHGSDYTAPNNDLVKLHLPARALRAPDAWGKADRLAAARAGRPPWLPGKRFSQPARSASTLLEPGCPDPGGRAAGQGRLHPRLAQRALPHRRPVRDRARRGAALRPDHAGGAPERHRRRAHVARAPQRRPSRSTPACSTTWWPAESASGFRSCRLRWSRKRGRKPAFPQRWRGKRRRGGTMSVLREVPEGVQSEIDQHLRPRAAGRTSSRRTRTAKSRSSGCWLFPTVERETLTYEAALVARRLSQRRTGQGALSEAFAGTFCPETSIS